MTAIYPGSFDPVTFGHLDIIHRAAKFTDHLIVAVLINSAKSPTFSVEERIAHLKELTKHLPGVTVVGFSGLLVDFARQSDAKLIIRGIRAVTDFEFEFQLALTNRSLDSEIETLFISTSTTYLYLSSSIVKEVAQYGGNIDEMVPPLIKAAVLKKLEEKSTR